MNLAIFLGGAALGFWMLASLAPLWLTVAYALAVLWLLFRRMKRAGARHAAALNAVLAKHTWQTLAAPARAAVQQRAWEIIRKSGGRQTDFSNETSEYGWYALAMAELGIPAAVPDFKGWNIVRNPNVETYATDFWMQQVRSMCRSRYGIDVEFSPADKTLDLIRSSRP